MPSLLSSWSTSYSPFTRIKHSFRIAVPIPPDRLTAEDVISALHEHSNCLTLQALTTGYREIPTSSTERQGQDSRSPAFSDPYFTNHTKTNTSTDDRVKSYLVTEGVPIIPGLGDWGKKFITFPVWFMDTARGVRTRGDAPMGVTVWAEYSVESQNWNQGQGQAEAVLVEDVTVECARVMMPFVRRNAAHAHRGICRKILARVEAEKWVVVNAGSEGGGYE